MYKIYKPKKIIETSDNHSYHCVMIYLNDTIHEKDQSLIGYYNLQKLIPVENVYFEKDPYKKNVDLGLSGVYGYRDEYGYDQMPHVTILYGIKHEKDYFNLLRMFEKIKPPTFKVTEVSSFRNEEKKPYDVLKLTVESPDLAKINKKIQNEIDCKINFPDYKPHVTLAYIKPGTCEDIEKKRFDVEFTAKTATFSHADKHKLILYFKE